MKKVISFLVLFCVITLVLSGCNEIDKTKSVSEQSNSKNDEILNENKASLSINPVEFEVSATTYFLPDSSFGVFNYNEKYGLIDSNGQVIIKPIYEMLSAPSEGYLIAEKSDGSFSVVSTDGIETGKIHYKNGELEINRLLVYEDSSCNDSAGKFSDGLAFMSVHNSNIKSICVDTSGKVVFESELELIGSFVDGVAIGLSITDRYSREFDIVAIDKTGKELWRKTVADFEINTSVESYKIVDNIIIYKSSDNLWGAIDTKGNDIIPCEYEELTYAGNERIGFKEYGLWGYLDYNCNVIIEPKYDEGLDFRGGIALVKENSQSYFINTDGEILMDCDGTYISYYNNGVIIVDSSKIMDIEGNILKDVNVLENDIGGTHNGISYEGGEIICVFLRGVGEGEPSYTYYKIS